MLKGKVAEFSYDFSSFNKDNDIDIDFGFAAPKTLSAAVKYMNDIQEVYTESFVGFTTNAELSDKKVRIITQKLASAIDQNSVAEVKNLKVEYGNTPEFGKALKLLNEKCKTVWNPFDIKDEKIPKEAMKALGITNIPSLEFLLGGTIKYFEKDNCKTTSKTIQSILNNKNLNYTIEDIHQFLKSKNSHLNYNTVRYLVENHNYNSKKLKDLGVEKTVIKSALCDIPPQKAAEFYLESAIQAIYTIIPTKSH